MERIDELRVNGRSLRVDAEADHNLLGVLRDRLGLTGTKYGCGEGRCGACTVLVDGQAVRSCLAKVGAVAGKSVTTIEGLAGGETLHPIQKAFLDHGAFQCGYCTSGMIMAAAGFLAEHPRPSEAEIIDGLQGNICRCGTYRRIIDAVRQAAETVRAEGGGR